MKSFIKSLYRSELTALLIIQEGTSKVGAKPKAQKAQKLRESAQDFYEKTKNLETQKITKFETGPSSLVGFVSYVRKGGNERGTICTTLDAFSLAIFGWYCKLEECFFFTRNFASLS